MAKRLLLMAESASGRGGGAGRAGVAGGEGEGEGEEEIDGDGEGRTAAPPPFPRATTFGRSATPFSLLCAVLCLSTSSTNLGRRLVRACSICCCSLSMAYASREVAPMSTLLLMGDVEGEEEGEEEKED